MKNILIILLLITGTSSAFAQSTSTLKAQIEFCRDEVFEKETKIKDYQEVMKKQHSEILSSKKEINDLKKKISTLNSENDRLRLENSTRNDPVTRYYKLAQKFERRKLHTEAIELYNVIIDTYPHTQEAMSARNILRSYKNTKGKKKK